LCDITTGNRREFGRRGRKEEEERMEKMYKSYQKRNSEEEILVGGIENKDKLKIQKG
jgi:hypothetical protein